MLTNSGTVLVLDHTALSLVGTISNSGTIFEDATSVSGATTVHITGQSATLSGAGQFLMSDNANNAVSGSLLINAGNLISGAGQFGNGGMSFDNKTGNLRGTGTNALVINLGQGNLLNEAAANIAAMGAGGVSMTQGIFTNKGTMTANDGSSLIYQSGALNTNLAAGALIGGTWRAIAAGHGATLTLSSSAAGGGVVATDAAVVVLSGSGSLIQSFDPTSGTIKTLEQTLGLVATGGQLQVLANRDYTSTLDFADSGIVQLGGGTFQTKSLNVAAGGLLNGFGTVSDAVANAGKIEAKGGLLTVTGNITGAGALQIDASSTLEVGGSSSETATYTGVGQLQLDRPNQLHGSDRRADPERRDRPGRGHRRDQDRGRRFHAHRHAQWPSQPHLYRFRDRPCRQSFCLRIGRRGWHQPDACGRAWGCRSGSAGVVGRRFRVRPRSSILVDRIPRGWVAAATASTRRPTGIRRLCRWPAAMR